MYPAGKDGGVIDIQPNTGTQTHRHTNTKARRNLNRVVPDTDTQTDRHTDKHSY